MNKFIGVIFALLTVSGLVVGVPNASARTLSVTTASDNNCADDDCDLQSALDAAAVSNEDDTINIGAGTFSTNGGPFTYEPNGAKDFSLTLNGAAGGGTVLEGNEADQVLTLNTRSLNTDLVADLSLNRLTIQNAATNLNGGGLFVETNDAAVSIADSIFNGNIGSGSAEGGGLYVETDAGAISLLRNILTSNHAGSAGGAFIMSNDGQIVIDSNIFRQNRANMFDIGALFIDGPSSSILIRNNLFDRNTSARDTGAIDVSGPGDNDGIPIVMVHNSFYKNTAVDDGGAMTMFSESLLDLFNNIFYQNSSTNEDSHDLLLDAETGVPVDTIRLFNNIISAVCFQTQGCDFENEIVPANQGNNQLGADPHFVDPDNGDLHLQAMSPAINMGDAAAPQLPSEDFEGDDRVIDGTPDIGADEFDPSAGSSGSGASGSGTGNGDGDGEGGGCALLPARSQSNL